MSDALEKLSEIVKMCDIHGWPLHKINKLGDLSFELQSVLKQHTRYKTALDATTTTTERTKR